MKTVVKTNKLTWVDIQNTTEEDIAFLKKKFSFHPLVLEELTISSAHRPRVERYDDYLFMTIPYPAHSTKKRETRPRELDIIITKNVIITGHEKTIAPLSNVLSACKKIPRMRKKYMGSNSGLLLFYILNSFWQNCLLKAEKIDDHLDEIEESIFKGKEKEMVLEISLVKMDIINFWRIIEPQQKILESLEKEGTLFLGKEMAPYFSDLLGTYEKVRNSVENFKETILALEDTNQSLLSTKINEIMRILTVFSVIMLPLTLIASMWGMNVPVPWKTDQAGFIIISIGMMLLSIFLVIYFYRKKWL